MTNHSSIFSPRNLLIDIATLVAAGFAAEPGFAVVPGFAAVSSELFIA